MQNHWHPKMRQFVFVAMAALGAAYYSFVGDSVVYTDAKGSETTTTVAQLKANMFDQGFDAAQLPAQTLKPAHL